MVRWNLCIVKNVVNIVENILYAKIATIKKNNQGGDTMLHLEIYLGTASGSLTNTSNTTYDYVTKKVYSRRRDIVNPEFVLDLIN